MPHKQFKQQEFTSVNDNWINTNLLIYTNTLAVGVDFSLQYFDMFIHVYPGRVVSPDIFIQSMMRVRHFNHNQHILFIKQSREIKGDFINPTHLIDNDTILCSPQKKQEYLYNDHYILSIILKT